MAAYIVSRIQVDDPERYKDYTAHTPGIAARHGGKFLIRGGAIDALEGPVENRRVVVIEFPSKASAKAFYEDPDYQKIIGIRHQASTGEVLLLEGA